MSAKKVLCLATPLMTHNGLRWARCAVFAVDVQLINSLCLLLANLDASGLGHRISDSYRKIDCVRDVWSLRRSVPSARFEPRRWFQLVGGNGHNISEVSSCDAIAGFPALVCT